MRKIICGFIIILMFICLQAGASQLPDEVKVGLKYGDTTVSTIPVICPKGALVTDVNGVELYRQEGAVSMTVKAGEGTSIDVYIGEKAVASLNDDIYIAPISDLITLNTYTYRGKLLFKRINGANLTVINQLKMDDYLRGVVPREIGGSSPIEAMKAQAITARSYAASNMGRHKSDGFDFCYTTHCQVYGNISGETTSANKAVDETSGIVGTYEGKIAQMFFFASDGGYTENVENVWNTAIPYLIAVEDPYETDKATNHTWSVTLTNDEVTDLFSQFDLGDIKDIKILEITKAGSVLKLEIVGTKNSKIMEREGCRTVFNGKVNSQAFDIEKKIEGQSMAYMGLDSVTTQPLGSTIQILGASGKSEGQINGINVLSSSGNSQFWVQEGEVTSYTINGVGWGHRLGMSQWGAIAMAEQGFTYDQILKFYYTGITIGE